MSDGDLWARAEEGQHASGVANPGPAVAAAARPAEIRVLSPERYSLRVTLSAGAHAKLRRAQDLMRHSVPDGDPAAIIDRALTLLVEQLERSKFAAKKPPREKSPIPTRAASEGRRDGPEAPRTMSSVPRSGAGGERQSRHIPAATKREVWARDERWFGYGGVPPDLDGPTRRATS